MAAASCSALSFSSPSPVETQSHRFLHLPPRSIPLSSHTTRGTASSLLFIRVSSPLLGRRSASSAPQPPPPEASSPDDSDSLGGFLEAFSRSRDVLRVFFGVLFWMSLFFWACAWDGKNSIGPNKRS